MILPGSEENMQLATFSAILQFAVDREMAALEAFSKACHGSDPVKVEAAGRLKSDAEKNVKSLQAILRENITELVMEPYDAIESDGFMIPDDEGEPLSTGVEILKKQQEFLRAAAMAIKMREVTRALEKIAGRRSLLLADLAGKW